MKVLLTMWFTCGIIAGIDPRYTIVLVAFMLIISAIVLMDMYNGKE